MHGDLKVLSINLYTLICEEPWSKRDSKVDLNFVLQCVTLSV